MKPAAAHSIYGVWLLFCTGVMIIGSIVALVEHQPDMVPMATLGGTALMLWGRLLWKARQ